MTELRPLPEAVSRLGRVVEHGPLAHAGQSGAVLERVVLADGTRLILKHVTPGGDWLSRASRDDGREARLWEDGTLAGLPAQIDTAIVAVEHSHDGYCLVMRDVTRQLLPPARLDRDTTRRLIDAAAAMHHRFADAVPARLLPLADRLRIPTPAALRTEDAAIPRAILEGWTILADHAPRDVADAVAAIHANPEDLAAELATRTLTLVHGDFRPANLGLTARGVVVLDWSVAGPAPPAMELAWMLLAARVGLEPTEDEVIEEFRRAWGDLSDERALRLSVLAGLAHVGCHAALALRSSRPGAAEKLAWWIERAREAL